MFKNHFLQSGLFFLIFCILSGSAYAQLRQFDVDTDLIRAKKFRALDFDGDYDIDLIAAASDTTVTPVFVAWYEQESDGSFTKHVVSTVDTLARSIGIGNITGDSRLEIIVGTSRMPPIPNSYHTPTTNPPAASWSRSEFDGVRDSTYSMETVDLDDDGDLDVLGTNFGDSGDGDVFWFRNDGGGSFSRQFVEEDVEGPTDAVAADFDGDGDLDIVTGEYDGDNIVVYTNDGSENFSRQVLSGSFNGPNSVDVGDFDNDGDLDIVACAFLGGRISWWENLTAGGAITFTGQNLIVTGVDRARSVSVRDVNSDDIDDFIAAGEQDDQVDIFISNGDGTFNRNIISTNHDLAYYATGADMDGDGDMDIIATAENLNTISWWETEQQDDQEIAAGDVAPASFEGGNVVIDFSAGTADTVTVHFNAGDVPDRDDLDATIDHVSEKGWYTITTQKTGYAASVDFSYGAGVTGAWGSITDENDLVICLFNQSTRQWELAGSSQTIDAVNDVITVNGINSDFIRYSRWTLGSSTSDNPLPVQLASFGASSTPDGVTLSWTTASELNNQGFELWRASDLNTTFEQIASYGLDRELIGQGNASQQSSYRYLDINVSKDMRYEYKLFSVDFDGTRWENGRTALVFDGKASLLTFELNQNYPNPFNGVTQIPFSIDRNNARGKLEIFDVLGRKIRSYTFRGLEAGPHQITWDARDDNGEAVGSGQYLYVLTIGDQRLSNRLTYVK